MASSMRLTFVGTGVSCAVPVIGHVDLEKQRSDPQQQPSCCCTDAVLHPDGPNHRNNASLLISLFAPPCETPSQASSTPCTHVATSHILVDAGKTFRDAYFRVLAPLHVARIDVLLLTHGHADAMHCVEEVCAWQASSSFTARRYLPTFLTRKTADEVTSISPELMAHSYWEAASPAVGRVAEDAGGAHWQGVALAMHEIAEEVIAPLSVDAYLDPSLSSASAAAPDGFPCFSVPVYHGTNYISMAFVFGSGVAFRSQGVTIDAVVGKTCVVYISDVSAIPDASMAFLRDLVKIDVLIFDLLAEKGSQSPSHTCWDDIMPFIRALTPSRTYFVGMFCSLTHQVANEAWARDLAEEKKKVRAVLADAGVRGAHSDEELAQMNTFLARVETLELAYDGLQLVLPR